MEIIEENINFSYLEELPPIPTRLETIKHFLFLRNSKDNDESILTLSKLLRSNYKELKIKVFTIDNVKLEVKELLKEYKNYTKSKNRDNLSDKFKKFKNSLYETFRISSNLIPIDCSSSDNELSSSLNSSNLSPLYEDNLSSNLCVTAATQSKI